MEAEPAFEQSFEISGGDFSNAGEVSSKVKKLLQELGVSPKVIRRATIATYEAEMNVVWYAKQGTLTLSVTPEMLRIVVADEGHGIENIELAMKEGYSTASPEIREKGFGAGMGLPNIKKNSDEFYISSVVGKGTVLEIALHRK
ncbi:MAG: anti-sigma regulatory factor [Deltaproteobacteria bacterium RBG_19FT_COMBO_52_11]|jgi:anti-sigma regulatory factor (Ser/Thr protein kinase)|nr:MAG: anti-sigma regulatory factor [Deltaproteobacteria bacterium RBG_19FT_COMBO_52_11]